MLQCTPRRAFAIASLLIFFIFAAVNAEEGKVNGTASEQENAENPSNIKNETAGGHSYHDHNDDYDAYGGHGHHYPHSNHHGYGYGQSHHLVDDYVCDFDASILVVTNSHKKHDNKDYKSNDKYGHGGNDNNNYGHGKDNYGHGNNDNYGHGKDNYGQGNNNYGHDNDNYGHGKDNYGHGNNNYGHGNDNYGHGHDNYGHSNEYDNDYDNHAIAHRLRCSVVAIRNDSDCTTCCQLAARRDRSVARNRIIGFIVDNTQIYQKEYGERKKREIAKPPGTEPKNSVIPKENNWTPKENNWAAPPPPKYEHEIEYGKNRPPTPVFPPYNPRCVCCAPKPHYNNHHHGHDYGHNDHYDNDNHYGNDNYGDNYGHNSHNGNYGSQRHGYNAPPSGPYNNNNNNYNKYPNKGGYGQ